MKRYSKPTVVTRQKCLVDGCERLEELSGGRPAGGLCSTHRKRKVRRRWSDAPIRSYGARPRAAIVEGIYEVADADSDEEFERALERFFKRIQRYFQKRRVRRAGQ